MAATMKWKVTDIVYNPTKEGKSKVVYDGSWRWNGSEEKLLYPRRLNIRYIVRHSNTGDHRTGKKRPVLL